MQQKQEQHGGAMAAKRLTDTGKWDQAWFRQLSPKLKTINDYICDKCDHAGIWEIDLETLSFFVNEKNSDGLLLPVTLPEIFQAFNGKVRLVRNDKLFLEGSAIFQYKLKSLADLKFTNNAQMSVIKILEKFGIIRIDHALNDNGDESTPVITILEPQGIPMSGVGQPLNDPENLMLPEKTTAEPVGGPTVETKDSLGPIEEFSKSEILRPVLASIAKSAQRQWVTRYKDVAWLIGNLEDAVSYYTASGEGNQKTWGKLLVLWLRRSKDKPSAFKLASGNMKDPFDFDPSPDEEVES